MGGAWRCRGRIAVVVAAAVLVAACSGNTNNSDNTDAGATSSTPAKDQRGGTLRRSSTEPDSIDPNRIIETDGGAIARLLYVGLVSYDDDMKVVPGVASKWDIAADGRTYTFHLRDDATFSDGTPVTAGDFVYSAKRFLDPDFASPSTFTTPVTGWNAAKSAAASGVVGDVDIPGLVAVDDHTLEVRLDSPYLFLLDDLVFLYPVPASALDSEAKVAAFGDRPLGNGPYRMAEPWRHNTSITLERSPTFFGTPGNADRIETVIFADSLAAYREVQAGNLDVGVAPPSQIAQARSEFGKRYLQAPASFLYYVGYPVNSPPYDSALLRKAISLSIDREAVTERLLDGASIAADRFVPPGFRGASPDACPNVKHDPGKAKELYEESGGVPGKALTAYYPSGQGLDDLAQAIANDVRQTLGVELTFKQIEVGQYTAMLLNGMDGPFGGGWASTIPSAYGFVGPLFETGQPGNFGKYSNPSYDALMKKVRESTDLEQADTLLRQAQDILCEDLPVIPLAFPGSIFVHSERVEGLTVDAFGELRLEQVIVRS